MIFYKFQMDCYCARNAIGEIPADKRTWRMQLGDLSEALSEGIGGDKIRILIYHARQNAFQMLAAIDDCKEISVANLTKLLEKFFAEHDEFQIGNIRIRDLEEITTAKFSKILDRASHSDNFNFDYYQLSQDLRLDALEGRTFKLIEIISLVKRLSFASAMHDAEQLLADNTFKEELNRIYAKENIRRFCGQPVHYKIVAGKPNTAFALSNMLVSALYTNKRLVSRRINIITDICDNYYNEADFESVIENAEGGTLVIDMGGERIKNGQFASIYEEIVESLAYIVRRYQRNTLFIFVEMTDKPGFVPKLISQLQDDLHIIELHEGAGNRDMALDYLKNYLADTKYATYTDAELLEAMGDKLTFSTTDIFSLGEKLFNSSLKNKTYPAYREVDRLTIKHEDKVNDAYSEFREMIGLTEQKALIEQIIAAYRVEKMRKDMNLGRQKAALHMSFTGNPGTAKTTVARLIAQILSREGVLNTGRFIECGRADLVAKYVGWTAKAVRAKFNEARGGVLFIDEAYSLSDGEHATFGDEALNTIVQEMENHRDDVIVIFAGYPDKMKDFLDRNEGLRSRIAFHVDFPDYTPDELTDIFKLMAKRRGFKITEEIAEHCKNLFKRVAKKKNFGNGRFVRTLLEQAWLKQAQRIVKKNEGDTVTKEDLTSFVVEDFDVNVEKKYKHERKLGFVR